LNCLTAKEWVKAMISVWEVSYSGVDIRDKKLHPAVFPVALAERVIETFTHKGELVVDPFVGSGTTLVAACRKVRSAVGFDLREDYVKLSASRVDALEHTGTAQLSVCDDARNIPQYLSSNSISLVFTSPPYAGLLNRKRRNKSRHTDTRQNEQFETVEQYSQDTRDLGTLGVEEFSETAAGIFAKLLPLLRKNAHVVVNMGNNLWSKNRRHDLYSPLAASMEGVGYELRNVIVWDKRKLVNGTGIFGWPSNFITLGASYEYLFDFTVRQEPR